MTLSNLETRWAEAAMGAIFPGSTDGTMADIRDMDVRGFLTEVMHAVPFQAALGLRIAIWLVALAPLFVIGRFRTIAGLQQLDRERVVSALVAHRSYALRSLTLILKTMGALLWAGDDAVRARMLAPTPSRALTPAPKNELVPLRVKRAAVA
jgi:hypothetical protein